MSKSLHTEAQIIGAVKQVEAVSKLPVKPTKTQALLAKADALKPHNINERRNLLKTGGRLLVPSGARDRSCFQSASARQNLNSA